MVPGNHGKDVTGMQWLLGKPGKHLAAIIVALSLVTFQGCLKFDNPVEDETGGPASPKVNVNVSGVDTRASILVVDLEWYEVGVSGFNDLRKTVELPVSAEATTMSVSFDGLAPGRGAARAGSYIGACLWQDMAWGQEVRVDMNETGVTAVQLGVVVGDCEIDEPSIFDTSDGDDDHDREEMDIIDDDGTDGEDDEEGMEGDPEEDTIIDPNRIIDVPYTPRDPVFTDGLLDLPSGDWAYATSLAVPAGQAGGFDFFAMHSIGYLYLGFKLPNNVSADDQYDTITVAFDPDPGVEGDEFLLGKSWDNIRFCQALSTDYNCGSLPGGPVIDILKRALTATGWEVEMVIYFSTLGITSDVARALRFAVIFSDNHLLTAWPDQSVESMSPETWGYMESSDNWGFRIYEDGDVEEDDFEEEAEIDDGSDPDIETEAAEPDVEMADGDIDQDIEGEAEPEIDLDEAELETEEAELVSCTPNQKYCLLVGEEHFERLCNEVGDGWQSVTSCDNHYVCTTDICLPVDGCRHYPNSNPCDDFNPCTFNDTCSVSGCEGEWVDCDDGNDCTIDHDDELNQHVGQCCYYEGKGEGEPCDDGYDCTTGGQCEGGECVGDPIVGCCEGHVDDMKRIGDWDSGFCADVYEAVIGDYAFVISDGCSGGGAGSRFGLADIDDYPSTFPDDITQETQPEAEVERFYACNVQGLPPSVWASYHQAGIACENSGKRLCTETEWLAACDGTPAEFCNDDGARVTCGFEDYQSCHSNNVHDLLGNVEEWTEEQSGCGGSYIGGLECTCADRTSFANIGQVKLGFRCCTMPANQLEER